MKLLCSLAKTLCIQSANIVHNRIYLLLYSIYSVVKWAESRSVWVWVKLTYTDSLPFRNTIFCTMSMTYIHIYLQMSVVLQF